MCANQPEKGERGAIITVSSIQGDQATPPSLGYACAKGAINGLLVPAARELAQHGIRMMSIAPGIMAGPITSLFPPPILDKINHVTPVGKVGDPEDFATLAVECFQNSFLNGETIALNGGLKIPHNVFA
mmetsp:Transcript_6620/g.5921  ORF Transcript_6620/g.5921 Transcript_6620/m.5921 type:complete len:129 (+) Transcript_6620:378-764(+)